MKNYYDILDLTQDASKFQIKEAYRTLAKKYHPDSNNGSDQLSDQLKEVNEAKDVLSDKFKKLAYDQSLIQHNLSEIFYHQSTDTHTSFYAKDRNKKYGQKMQKPGIILGLFLLLAIFMLYLFPIRDNEWEIANSHTNSTTKVYYASNAVDDLFGREENRQPPTYQETEQIVEPLEKPLKHNLPTITEVAAENYITTDDINELTPDKLVVAALSAESNVVIKTDLPVKTTPTSSINLNKIHTSKGLTDKITITPTKVLVNTILPQPSSFKKQVPTKKVSYLMNEQDMAKVLGRLETQKLKFTNTTKCIQIAKTSTSNVSNAFDMADFLVRLGYAISGRKIVNSGNKGVAIDIKKSGCITLIIGSM